MSRLRLLNLSTPRLGPLNADLADGLYVVVGSDPAALAELVELVSGVAQGRGAVLLDDAELARSPAARRRLASLQASEPLLPAPSVREALELAHGARLTSTEHAQPLTRTLLEPVATLPPNALDNAARRAIALAVALESEASALVLYDPFAVEPKLPRERIISACQTRARQGVVLVATPELADAAALGGRLLVLAAGKLCSPRGLASTAVGNADVLVRSLDAKRLADLLKAEAALRVAFDEERSQFEFFVGADDLHSACGIICRTAWQHGLELAGLSAVFPELPALLARRRSLHAWNVDDAERPS